MASPATQLDLESLASLVDFATGRRPLPRPSTPDEPDKNKLVALVEALRKEAESDVSQDRVRWAMTDAFYAGNHWLGLSRNSGMPTPLPAERGRPRITINKFQKWIDVTVARLLSAHPKLIISPGSADDAVIMAARGAQRVIGEHHWRVQKMDGIMAQFVSGYYKHGDAALKVEYNPRFKWARQVPKPLRDAEGKRVQAVQDISDPMTGEAIQRPAFEPDNITPVWETEKDPLTGEPVMLDEYDGRCETSYVSAQDIFWEPAATVPEEAMWCIISQRRSPAWVFDRWGVEVEAQSSNSREFDTWRFRRDIRPMRPAQTVQVDELWIKAGRYRFGDGPNDIIELSKGYVCVTAGNKLLDVGENPYNHGEFPICFERALIDEKRMRGLTPAGALRELNVGINKTCSGIALIIDMCGDPQWILPNECEMPEADKVNGPGKFKRVATPPGGQMPQVVPGQSAPSGTFEFLKILDERFGADLSGQHEGGLGGGAPPGVEAGVALEAIVERDTTSLAQIAAGVGRLVARWGYLTACNIQQFEPEQKQIAVVGEWGETEILQFGGVDIYNTFEFDVVPNSYLPQSKAAEFQKDLVLKQEGMLSPRDFMKRNGEDRVQMLSLPQIDAANARRENWQAQQPGGVIETPDQAIFEDDDPMVHIEEHSRLIKDRNFMRDNPQGYMQLKMHVQKHIMVAQQQMAMAGPAGAPQGGEPVGGGPPPQPNSDPSFGVPAPGRGQAA